MRSPIIAFAVVAALASSARAEPAANPLTVSDCLQVLSGLRALSGRHDAVVADKVTQVPWKFDGPTLLTIGLDIGALTRVEAALTRTRQELLAQHPDKDGNDARPGTRPYNEFVAEFQKALDAPCDVKPGRIKKADLRLGPGAGENAIPGDVIGAISAIIDLDDGR